MLDELMTTADPDGLGPPVGEPPIDPRSWLPDVGHERQLRPVSGLDHLPQTCDFDSSHCPFIV